MQVLEAMLTRRAMWRVFPEESTTAPLSSIGGCQIVAPHFTTLRDPPHLMCQLDDGSCLVSAQSLYLSIPSSIENKGSAVEKLSRDIGRFLRALRVVSRQASLPREVCGFIGPTNAEIPSPLYSLPDRRPGSIRKYIVDSAVRWEHFAHAEQMVVNDEIPVHGELINDASEAIMQSNYRSSILFAAMAMESCAGTVLDREYEQLLNRPLSTDMRCTRIQVTKDEFVLKDPVYVSLRAGSSDGGSRFLGLLHECPLYLLKKSLQLQEPATYTAAHALYRTRNSLAHTGTTDNSKAGMLSVDYAGAVSALHTANRVLNWFGEKGTVIPGHEFEEYGTTE